MKTIEKIQMKSKLVLLTLLLAGTSEAAMPSIVISATGGVSMAKNAEKSRKIYAEIQKNAETELAGKTEEQINGNENLKMTKGTIDNIKAHQAATSQTKSASFVVDTNIAVTFAKDKFFFGIAGGYMHNFGSQTAKNSATSIDRGQAMYFIGKSKEGAENEYKQFKTTFENANNNDPETVKARKVCKALNISSDLYLEHMSYVMISNLASNLASNIEAMITTNKTEIKKEKETLESSEYQEYKAIFEKLKTHKDYDAQMTKKLDNWSDLDETKKGELRDKIDEMTENNANKVTSFKIKEAYVANLEKQLDVQQKLAPVATKSISAQHSHMFYAGPVFGYNFNEKISAGLSLNYVASSVNAKIAFLDANKKEVEGLTKEFESEIFHGVMPTLFASYAIGKGISAKVSVGYAIFFNKDAQAGKASELVELGNVFIATAGVSFKAV